MLSQQEAFFQMLLDEENVSLTFQVTSDGSGTSNFLKGFCKQQELFGEMSSSS